MDSFMVEARLSKVPKNDNERRRKKSRRVDKVWYISIIRSSGSSTFTARTTKPPQSLRSSPGRTWSVCWVGVAKFLKVYKDTGSIARCSGSVRPSKINSEIKEVVEEAMQRDNETTAVQLHRLLTMKRYRISLHTILRCHTSLGWTYRGSAYCELIRDVNKQKRLAWAQQHVGDMFEDIIWTDEASIQMESHRRFCCRKCGKAPRPKPRSVQCACACWAPHCKSMCTCM